MTILCSICEQPFHPATGHAWTKNVQLCWACALDWFRWYKERMSKMSHPKKGMQESFHDCALKSIKVP